MFGLQTGLLAVALLAVCACNNKKASVTQRQSEAAPPPAGDLSVPAAPLSTLPRSESKALAPGRIKVTLLEVLDSAAPPFNQAFIRGRIAEDVLGADRKLAIPAGAGALILPTQFGKVGEVSQIGLSLFAVELDGRQYRIKTAKDDPATALITDDIRQTGHSTAHLSDGSIVEFTLKNGITLR